jgi:aerobic-type carbon monoxide dehydrogenase small subunit (CoxS/CutS family)
VIVMEERDIKVKEQTKRSGSEKPAGVVNSSAGYISMTVNGEPRELMIGKDVQPWHTLAYTIRETLGYTGTKISCDNGACGACTVLMNGKPVLSCMMLTVECDGKIITTIEGLEDPKTGELHPIQQAFIDRTAFQCGFCTPGIIMSTKGLLDENPSPSEQEIKEVLSGHYCRCISHYHVLDAVKDVISKSEVK